MDALSPTCNTLESTSESTYDAITDNWGIDTVVLAYDIDPASVDTEHSMWKKKSVSAAGAELPENAEYLAEVLLGETQARVRLCLYPGTVSWEFEAGQLAGFPRPRLLHPDALMHLVERLIDDFTHAFLPHFISVDQETGEMVWDPTWREQVRIRRLDVTRDLAVPRHLEAAFKTVLVRTTPRYSKGAGQRYSNRNGGSSFYNLSNTQGCDRLYNKDAQMKIKGHPDVIRWRLESELRKDRLIRFQLRKLSEVSGERVWAALEARWKALRLDGDLPYQPLLTQHLAGLDTPELIEAMAYLGLRTFEADDVLPRRKRTAIRRTIKSVGLHPGKGLFDQPCTYMRLSLKSGLLSEA